MNVWSAVLVAGLAVHNLAAAPQTVQVANHTLTRVSEATRSRLFGLLDVYRVSIYVPRGHATLPALWSAGTAVALRVEVLYNGPLPDHIPSAWKKELMPVLSAAQAQLLKKGYARLESGDVIEIRFVPGGGTAVSVAGRPVLTDRGFELMAAFLNIWMGQTPVSEDVKRELLRGLQRPAPQH